MDSSSWSSLNPVRVETDARVRARAALHAAARGEQQQTEALLIEVERAARGSGHAFERALVHLARAILLALDGAVRHANLELMRALHAAASEQVDPELVMAALRELGDVAVITGAGQRWLAASAELALPAHGVVLDARSDTLTAHGETRTLRHSPVRRRLLYTLARHPGTLLGKEALTEAVWDCAYDPLRHDDLIKATVLHLRRVIAPTGITVICGHPGYRLDAEPPFAFVSPFLLGRATTARLPISALAPRAAR
jgi:DNA-binding response OmpR family regulator